MSDELIWHVYLDWNNDGVYESDEGARLIAPFHSERGQDLWLTDPMAGQCSIKLDNHDRRFDWWYAGSIVYPNSLIGKRALITVTLNGTEYNVFSGYIDVPAASAIRAPDPAGGASLPVCTLTIHDGWQWLKDHKAEIALQTNITTKAAIQMLLDAVGWGSSSSDSWILGTSQLGVDTVLGGISDADADLGSADGDTLPYWWSENEPSDANLLELIKAHFARAWIGADGKFRFRTLAQDNGASADLTLTDAIIQELLIYQRVDELANKVTVCATPYGLQASADIWTLGETPQIQPGETLTYHTRRGTPATNQVTPAATTDYTANTLEDGSGIDLTASLSATMTINSSFDETITITNNGARPGFVTLLKMRGQSVEAQDATAQIAEDTTSQQTYGERGNNSDYTLRWQQNSEIARDLANFVLAWRKDPRSNLQVQLQHRAEALLYDVGTKILDGTTVGLPGASLRLGKVVHDCSDEAMQNLTTQWFCYPLPPVTYWILGESMLGIDTILGV